MNHFSCKSSISWPSNQVCYCSLMMGVSKQEDLLLWLSFNVVNVNDNVTQQQYIYNMDYKKCEPHRDVSLCIQEWKAHCWVYVMSIRQTQDMKSKCHISHISSTNYIFGKIKTLCYINFKNCWNDCMYHYLSKKWFAQEIYCKTSNKTLGF